jgi:hypothetical protein
MTDEVGYHWVLRKSQPNISTEVGKSFAATDSRVTIFCNLMAWGAGFLVVKSIRYSARLDAHDVRLQQTGER